jgi:hypothetical protein
MQKSLDFLIILQYNRIALYKCQAVRVRYPACKISKPKEKKNELLKARMEGLQDPSAECAVYGHFDLYPVCCLHESGGRQRTVCIKVFLH